MKAFKGIFAVLTAGMCWGVIGLFIKPLTAMGYTQYEIIFMRALMTVLIVLPLARFKEKTIRINLKDLWIYIGMGCVSFLLFNICYLACIQLTGMGIAAVLLYTAPAFVMLFSALLFREKITLKKTGALLLALIGCVCVTGIIDSSEMISLSGLLLGLGAGLGYSLYSIFGRYALDRVPSLTATGWAFVFAALGSCFFVDFNHFLTFSVNHPSAFSLLLACGLLCNVFPYILYTYGLTQMESSKASVIACVEPVVAFIAGIIVYQEPVTLIGIIGVLLVLGAVLLLNDNGKGS